MAECDHFKDNDESMLGTLADGTVECAMCKAQFVPASKLDDALDKAGRFDRAEVWAGKVEVENAELRSRLDAIRKELERVSQEGPPEFSGHRADFANYLLGLIEPVVERQERSNCAECSATAYDHDHGGHFAECSQYTPPSE